MRKLLASLLVLTIPVTTFAGTVDLHSVIVQNNETTDSFTLNAESTRTAYRTEVVQDTCYRQEVVGYERVCEWRSNDFNINSLLTANNDKPRNPNRPDDPTRPSPGPRPDPRPRPEPGPRPDPRPRPEPGPRPDPRPRPEPGPRPDPRPRPEPRPPRQVCYDRPIYRSVAYSCSRTVTVPYEVRESHAATTNVRVSAAPVTRPQTGNCGLHFQLAGASYSVQNTCSEYIATANISQSSNNGVANYNYDVTLHDGVRLLAPLAGGLRELKLDNGTVLTSKVGNLNEAGSFTLKLYVERKKLFGSDDVLINRVLQPHEFSYQAINDKTGYVLINFDKVFGGIENGKKHDIKLSLSVNLPAGTLISGGALGQQELSQSAELTVR